MTFKTPLKFEMWFIVLQAVYLKLAFCSLLALTLSSNFFLVFCSPFCKVSQNFRVFPKSQPFANTYIHRKFTFFGWLIPINFHVSRTIKIKHTRRNMFFYSCLQKFPTFLGSSVSWFIILGTM